jgi:hypothetical protein
VVIARDSDALSRWQATPSLDADGPEPILQSDGKRQKAGALGGCARRSTPSKDPILAERGVGHVCHLIRSSLLTISMWSSRLLL